MRHAVIHKELYRNFSKHSPFNPSNSTGWQTRRIALINSSNLLFPQCRISETEILGQTEIVQIIDTWQLRITRSRARIRYQWKEGVSRSYEGVVVTVATFNNREQVSRTQPRFNEFNAQVSKSRSQRVSLNRDLDSPGKSG